MDAPAPAIFNQKDSDDDDGEDDPNYNPSNESPKADPSRPTVQFDYQNETERLAQVRGLFHVPLNDHRKKFSSLREGTAHFCQMDHYQLKDQRIKISLS